MKRRLLVVEDEQDLRNLMSMHLSREGYEVSVTENGEQALALLEDDKNAPFDVVVLDWMLPGLSGLDLCRRMRAGSGPSASTAVLMVTARTDPTDIVLGLEAGADDYVTKPFEIPVFLARVRALLRRAALSSAEPAHIEAGKLSIDTERYRCICSGQEIQLTPSEFKLLTALMKNQGRVLPRDKLIDLVQGEGVAVVDRTIDTHVFGLRKKLGACADLIETIRGVGYRVRAL